MKNASISNESNQTQQKFLHNRVQSMDNNQIAQYSQQNCNKNINNNNIHNNNSFDAQKTSPHKFSYPSNTTSINDSSNKQYNNKLLKNSIPYNVGSIQTNTTKPNNNYNNNNNNKNNNKNNNNNISNSYNNISNNNQNNNNNSISQYIPQQPSSYTSSSASSGQNSTISNLQNIIAQNGSKQQQRMPSWNATSAEITMLKKQDGSRTVSSHSNQTYFQSQQNIANIMQNYDNSKSTDNSPQVRPYSNNYINNTNNSNNGNNNYNNNINQYISQLSLAKNYNGQFNTSGMNSNASKNLLKSSTGSLLAGNNNTLGQTPQVQQSYQKKQSPSYPNLYQQSPQTPSSSSNSSNINNQQLPLYQKNGYLQQNISSSTQQHNYSSHKSLSATLPQTPLIYISPSSQQAEYLNNGNNNYNNSFFQTSSLQLNSPHLYSSPQNILSSQQQFKNQSQQQIRQSQQLDLPLYLSQLQLQQQSQQLQQSNIELNKGNHVIDNIGKSKERDQINNNNGNIQQQNTRNKSNQDILNSNNNIPSYQHQRNVSYSTQQQSQQQSQQDNQQYSSSNATEEEGAKLQTIESGSINLQQQPIQLQYQKQQSSSSQLSQKQTQQSQILQSSPQQKSYNSDGKNKDKDTRIQQLEKDKIDLLDKIKNLELQLENAKELQDTQIKLEKYQIKEFYEKQQQNLIDSIKSEFQEKEIKLNQQIQIQTQRNQSQDKDSVQQVLQSVISQNQTLFNQFKWIQDKLSQPDTSKDQPKSDITKSEIFQISIDNILPNHKENHLNSEFKQNNNNNNNNNAQEQKNNQSQLVDDKKAQNIFSDVIQEEDDNCSSQIYQDKNKTPQMKTSQIKNAGLDKNSQDNEESIIASSPTAKKKLVHNSSILFSLDGRIEELERIIGAKNNEIIDLKEKLYEAKDCLIQNFPNQTRISYPMLQAEDNNPQKRRKSFSSASDLHSLNLLQNNRKQIQISIMEWSYSFDCQGSVEKLLEDGWKIQELQNKVNLVELNQVIGVVGMPKTGKTTIINGLMKGNLQTVEELKKPTFFDSKLNIVVDENIAIFEYSYMQPVQIDNNINLSVGSIADLSQQKQYSAIMEEQILKMNKRDFFWIDFFIKNTQSLIVVFDKFTQEEQKMLSEILNRIENEEDLHTKELILIHNYYSKGLKSAEELQCYFGQSLQHIDTNFKQKQMVELKMYRTALVQKNTKSKKCIYITHILNGNLFEPFADKYQHNMLQYCMNKLSQMNQSSKKFLPQFQSFLQTNISSYLCHNNIPSFQQIDNMNQFKDYHLSFDQESSSLFFKPQINQSLNQSLQSHNTSTQQSQQQQSQQQQQLQKQ